MTWKDPESKEERLGNLLVYLIVVERLISVVTPNREEDSDVCVGCPLCTL